MEWFERELAGVRVEVEELAVAAPVDGDVELVAGFAAAEAATEGVEEEPGVEFPSMLELRSW